MMEIILFLALAVNMAFVLIQQLLIQNMKALMDEMVELNKSLVEINEEIVELVKEQE